MRRLQQILADCLAYSFGAGLSPVWPGTVGAAVGLLVAWPLAGAGVAQQAIALALLFAVGTWASACVARDRGEEDPQVVVVDETFGAAAVVLFLPVDPVWWLAGFLAFRFFDIRKVWPVDWLQDTVKGGLGIMLDDAGAALYALLVLIPLAWSLGAYG
ncbi:phosphatidylglycerophosphatase A family protein [Stappia sp. ICDLI1TA098]